MCSGPSAPRSDWDDGYSESQPARHNSDMTGGLVWSFNGRKCKLTRTLFPDRTKIKAWSVVSGQNVNLNTSPQELDINLSALGSIYLTAAVSIERYFTVCHPYYTVKLKHSSCENVS